MILNELRTKIRDIIKQYPIHKIYKYGSIKSNEQGELLLLNREGNFVILELGWDEMSEPTWCSQSYKSWNISVPNYMNENPPFFTWGVTMNHWTQDVRDHIDKHWDYESDGNYKMNFDTNDRDTCPQFWVSLKE